MTEDFDIAVRSILSQLLEARQDRDDADQRLRDYRAANTPPNIPSEFPDVETLLDYHHRRQRYEYHLKQHENAVKEARKEYADAAAQLLLFLPDGVPLRYTYEGERSELFGRECVIVRKRGEILIESPGRTSS